MSHIHIVSINLSIYMYIYQYLNLKLYKKIIQKNILLFLSNLGQRLIGQRSTINWFGLSTRF